MTDVVQNLLQSKSKVIAKHLVARQATYKKMRVFIYGHTHQFENPWSVDLDGLTTVPVANTGAFQCLLDEPGFLKRLNGRTPQDALRTMTLNELPACYSAVIVEAAADGTIPYEPCTYPLAVCLPATSAWKTFLLPIIRIAVSSIAMASMMEPT